jgi:membrane-bound ClpP family serine protease
MIATTRNPYRSPGKILEYGMWALALGFGFVFASRACPAVEETVEGLFITVGNPITSEVANRVKDTTTRAVLRVKSLEPRAAGVARRVLKIVYDFNPDDKPASTYDFGPCQDLAAFLLEQQDVHTIAFVHSEITRNTVLPVLACRDIIMSSSGRLGDVRRDQDPSRPLSNVVQAAYREVARDRRCPAVVLKMLDPNMELLRAKKLKGSGDWFIDSRLKEEEAKNHIVVLNPTPVIGSGAQSTLYTVEQAELLGLCALRKENRQEVAEAYGLPPTSLREDPLMGRSPILWRIDLNGPVTEALVDTIKRQIGRVVAQRANVILLQLECGGGDTIEARKLADYLRNLKDDQGTNPVMTVAYIPKRAPDTAVFVALGCTEIVMHKEATIGDFSSFLTERRNGAVVDVDPENYRHKRESLEGLAQAQGYPVLLARGMMDRELAIYQVRHKKTGEWAFITGPELQADRAEREPKWGHVQLIKEGGPRGRALVLNAEEAKRWGLARHLVNNLNEVYEPLGVDPSKVQVASPDWLDDLAAFLRQPLTRIFLIIIGIICLTLELKMPGLGVPGIISAVCFILFFWSHSQSASLDLLAVLLFVFGLALIGIEVFILPGFGIAGVSGTLLIVFSLALAAFGHRPQTSEEWANLMKLMAQFGLGLVFAVMAALLFAWYLPGIPFLNRLILKPQAEGSDFAGEEPAEPLRPEIVALLGAIGVVATPLHPAGKVKFGDEYIDVVAEGSFIVPGTRVQVVEIEGNRIVVKEVL